jgi:hypothetical protein
MYIFLLCNVLITLILFVIKLIKRTEQYFPMSDKSVRCPYCESIFPNNEDLSKHIDRIHLGSGLLEGDTRKF